jgi:sarcosine oxidase delta subunit
VQPEPVSLDIRCPHCGGEMTAEFADWRNDAELVDAVLECPYCGRQHRTGFPARLLWVAKAGQARGNRLN